MENVSGIIDAICAKLGVTMEHLIPAIIEFGTYDCQFTARVCIYILLFGIILTIMAFWLVRKGFDTVPFILFLVGITAIVCASVILIIALIELHKWTMFPEVMAYKELLHWIGSA